MRRQHRRPPARSQSSSARLPPSDQGRHGRLEPPPSTTWNWHAALAIVIGGSLGGLFAGTTLLRSGWDVTIVERSGGRLEGRRRRARRASAEALSRSNGRRVTVCRVRWWMTISFARLASVSACDHPARRVALCAFHTPAIATSKICLRSAVWISPTETVRRWVLKFGPLFASKKLRRRRPRPTSQWHLDEDGRDDCEEPAVLAVARG